MGHYYDHTGHRVLKKRKDGIMVYNINRLYELAVIPSEGERHTIYIYGQQGEMVAQRTINDAALLAANQRRAYSRALAKWADDGSLVGSVQAGYFLLGPELTDKENLTNALKSIFVLLVLMGLGYWGLPHYREGTEEQNKPFLQVNAFLVSLSVLYAFSFFRCGVNAPVLDGTEWTDEVVAIPPEVPGVEDPDNAPGNHDGPQDPNQPAPIASFPVEGIYFYHQDHLGSPALITNGAGVVVTVLAFKPYGELDLARSSGPDIIRYKYTLQEQDVETGLYNYRARYYAPASGGFTSADSLVPNSKDAGSYNRYGYVKGNPLKYVDPTGHFAVGAPSIPIFAPSLPNPIEKVKKKLKEHDRATGIIGTILTVAATIAVGAAVMAFAPGLSAYFASYALGYGSAGAVAGGSAGFISGFGISVSWGASFTDALKQGGVGAVVGMAGGGVGGLVGGAALGASGDAIAQHILGRTFGTATSSGVRAAFAGEDVLFEAHKGAILGLLAAGVGAGYVEKMDGHYQLRQNAKLHTDGSQNWGFEPQNEQEIGVFEKLFRNEGPVSNVLYEIPVIGDPLSNIHDYFVDDLGMNDSTLGNIGLIPFAMLVLGQNYYSQWNVYYGY